MKAYYIFQAIALIDALCKVCVSVFTARLILLISEWVKTAYRERNEWETVEEETDNDQ